VNKKIYASLFAIMFVLAGWFVNGGGADDDGGIDEIFGCMDSDATNFNPQANSDDSSCEYVIIPTADLNATIHFGEEYGRIAPIHGVNNGPLVRKAWE
jgi:hypothetical protein